MNTSHKHSAIDVETTPAACKVAILGFGTVGSSVARILSERTRTGLNLTHICNRNLERKKNTDWLPKHVQWTKDINDILSSDTDIVVEVIGGLQPAGDWVRSALRAGKSVVTANKQLIAHSGPELIDLARKMKRHIAFGASVAGGVPVISGLQEGLAGDELFKIYGILNGTCNYILSQIESSGVSFAAALTEAQKLGFAEADPTDDVDGLDARAKLAILARVGLHSTGGSDGHHLPLDLFHRSRRFRIRKTIELHYQANFLGGIGRPATLCHGAACPGRALLTPGARARQPESSDVHGKIRRGDSIRRSWRGRKSNCGCRGFRHPGNRPCQARHSSRICGSCRNLTYGHCGLLHPALSAVQSERSAGNNRGPADIFSHCGINIDSVLQKPGYLKSSLPFVITLEVCKASLVEKALQQISKLDFLVQPCVHLPILD